MAGATLSNQDAILHEHYGNLHWVLNTSTQVLNRLPRSTKKADGRQVRELIGHGMPTSILNAGPDASATPDPSTSANDEAIIQQCYRYGSIKIDWTIMHHSEGDHAYVSAMRQEVERFAKYEAEDSERQVVGDGSGRLGVDYGGVIDSGYLRGRVDVTSTTPLTFQMYGSDNAVFFRKGMQLEFWGDPQTPASGEAGSENPFNTWVKRDNPSQGYYTVNTVARTKSATAANDVVTVTCNENAPGAGNDPGEDEAVGTNGVWDVVVKNEAIVENNSSGSLNTTNEYNGLAILIDDGNAVCQTNIASANALADATLHGINAATNDFWQSEVADGTGSYFSLDMAQEVSDGIAQRSGEGAEGIRFLLMHHFQARKYSLSLTAQERYPNTGNVGKFSSGTSTMFNSERSVDIADKEIVKSRFQHRGEVLFVGKGIRHYDLVPWGWVQKDGIWHRDFNYGPNYRATALCYKNLGTTDRMCSGKAELLKAR